MEFDWYRPVSACLDQMKIGYRDIPLDEVRQRLPMVNPRDLLRVVETDGAGLLMADRILADLVGMLPRLGVELRPFSPVTDIDPEYARLGDWSGDQIVVAAGAWAGRLVGLAKLRSTAQTVVFLEPPADLAAAWQSGPVLLNRLPVASGGTYILPPRGGARLKAGDYNHTDDADPDLARVPTPMQIDRVLEAADRALSQFDRYRVLGAKSCRYAVTEDERFDIRPLGAGGWVVNACSGHGFKLAALVGEAVADGVTGARPADEVCRWMAGRLTES